MAFKDILVHLDNGPRSDDPARDRRRAGAALAART